MLIGGLSKDGTQTWQQGIKSEGSATVTGLAPAANGSYLVSASIEDDKGQAGLAAGFNQRGRLEFIHRYGGAGNQRALAITARLPSGYAVAGSSKRMQTLDQDMWLLIKR